MFFSAVLLAESGHRQLTQPTPLAILLGVTQGLYEVTLCPRRALCNTSSFQATIIST